MRVVFFAPFLLATMSFGTESQTIVFVDGLTGTTTAPSSLNAGSSWRTAYKFLQDGLARAIQLNPSDRHPIQVWVRGAADGRIAYFPDEDSENPDGSGDPTAHFSLTNNVAVYGGFAGDETQLDQRAPATYPVILSGDLNQDDGSGFVGHDENSLQVVFSTGVDDTAVLDGFTIQSAVASGMLNLNNASPRVARCSFVKNRGPSGGGMRNVGSSSPIVVNCSFIANGAAVNGGGLSTLKGSAPTIVNSRFINNTAGHVGGGMSSRGSGDQTVHVTNCLFQGNSSRDSGGGARAGRDTRSIFTNCTFVGNSTGGVQYSGYPVGGGGFAVGSDNVSASVRLSELHNCIFWDNHVSGNAQGPDVSINGVTYGLLDIEYTDVPGGKPDVFIGFNQPPPSGVDPLNWGSGNIDANPMFVDQAGGDFRLGDGSPCADAGENEAVPPDSADVDDADGILEPTPLDLGLGTRFAHQRRVDMGAYEQSQALSVDCLGDVTHNGSVNIDDLLVVITGWGECPVWPDVCDADIAPNPAGNATINIDDLLAVIGSWGNACEGGIADEDG